jgi:hypothetical protein
MSHFQIQVPSSSNLEEILKGCVDEIWTGLRWFVGALILPFPRFHHQNKHLS